jgi:4-hydroxy-2-oxoheptanedioate aldolase
MTKGQSLRSRIRAGETVHGLLTSTSDAVLVELLAMAGWDFLLLDGEHGSVDTANTADLARAARLHGVPAVVRVPGIQLQNIGRHLDFGATGIMAPMIETAVDAEALVAACRFPPDGRRGLAASPAAGFGLAGNLATYPARANAETIAIAQIETAAALGNLDSIAAVPGLDVLFIGAADLSTSLGHPLQYAHPDVLAALQSISAAARRHGIPLGMLVDSPDQLSVARYFEAVFVVTYLEPLLVRACHAHLGVARMDQD